MTIILYAYTHTFSSNMVNKAFVDMHGQVIVTFDRRNLWEAKQTVFVEALLFARPHHLFSFWLSSIIY